LENLSYLIFMNKHKQWANNGGTENFLERYISDNSLDPSLDDENEEEQKAKRLEQEIDLISPIKLKGKSTIG